MAQAKKCIKKATTKKTVAKPTTKTAAKKPAAKPAAKKPAAKPVAKKPATKPAAKKPVVKRNLGYFVHYSVKGKLGESYGTEYYTSEAKARAFANQVANQKNATLIKWGANQYAK